MASWRRMASAIGLSSVVCGVSLAASTLQSIHAKADTTEKSDYVQFDKDVKKWDDNWDLRRANRHVSAVTNAADQNNETNTPRDKKTPSTTGSRHIILVRHGQYHQQSEIDADRKLTDLGRQQALETGKRLTDRLPSIDRMVVSTMCRAIETANLISTKLDVEKECESCQLLCEGAPYPPEPKSKTWSPEKWRFFQDGPRIEAAFRKYFHRPDLSQTEDSHEVIVCHANVIRYFVCRALQFPPEGWLRMSLGNCSLTWITIRPNGRVSLRSVGDTGHLKPALLTFN